MKNGIKASMYYELLEWKDKNLNKFQELYGINKRLCDLKTNQLMVLYLNVTNGKY